MNLENVYKQVLDCAFPVHTDLVPGLLESAYEEGLFYEIERGGLLIKKQWPLPLIYKEIKLDVGYRVDLLIENQIIVEVKSVDSLADIHMAQILTYLKLSGCKLGLLAKFNVKHFKDGIKRVILS
jgi:GxxExxY protein